MARTQRTKNWDVPGPVKSELYLTDRDCEIFRLLDPEYGYHYLPSNWIHAFIGGDQLRRQVVVAVPGIEEAEDLQVAFRQAKGIVARTKIF